MHYYEKLYWSKENKKAVQIHLKDFLLFQIYSVPVIRQAYPNWLAFPWFLKENTPPEIQKLIEKSPYLKDDVLQTELNKYEIQKAIQVLKSYQNCGVPLTQDPTVKQTRRKLTSPKGDKVLKILQKAQEKGRFSDGMADLAIRANHKFLFDPKFFRKIYITKKFAELLATEDFQEETKEKSYGFPTIQLTKGCVNHCSHCGARAEAHLSHMPWPIFASLYRGLQKYYRHYPQKYTDHFFSTFFSDSDMLSYHDNIMGVDSGDVGLWITEEKGTAQYLTRGVTDNRSRLALAKALFSGQSMGISFVDTPKENMERNLKQLNETLNIVDSIPEKHTLPIIVHLHLKSGPTVSDKIARDYPYERTLIYPQGRANDFPAEELAPEPNFLPMFVFRPDGSFWGGLVQNREQVNEKWFSIYGVPPKGHMRGLKLFWHRHILSRFR